MQNLDLSSLNGLVLTVPEVSIVKGGVKIDRLPVNHDLRLFKTGALYPSKAFAEKYNLEYQAKVEVTDALGRTSMVEAGNGLDIFKSKDWEMLPSELNLLVLAISPKYSAKVDVWGRTATKEDGTPASSVLTQGNTTFSKGQLIDMLADVYNINWDVVDYVELDLAVDTPLVSPTGKYYLPTTVSRGVNKGEITIKTRENVEVFPLVVGNIEYLPGLSAPDEVQEEVVIESVAEAAVEESAEVKEDFSFEAN